MASAIAAAILEPRARLQRHTQCSDGAYVGMTATAQDPELVSDIEVVLSRIRQAFPSLSYADDDDDDDAEPSFRDLIGSRYSGAADEVRMPTHPEEDESVLERFACTDADCASSRIREASKLVIRYHGSVVFDPDRSLRTIMREVE